jgi:hypothetical protein
MDYEQAKAASERAWLLHKAASKALKMVIGVCDGRLTPDAVKATEEYVYTKERFEKAHKALREANAFLVLNFAKEYKADRAKRVKV